MAGTYITQLLELREEIAPEDSIMAIISQFNTDIVRKDHSTMQEVIFKLKNEENYKNILKCFLFDTSGITPYSKLLEQVLNRLETFSIFGTLNPKYNSYKVNKEFLQKAYEKFGPIEKQLICEMSNKMEKAFN